MSTVTPAQLSTLASAKVVCIGDVMLDRFVYGEVTRVSPEAPIPVCRIRNETAMLGGAGNVVRNLVALGASVDFIGVVGEDDIARDVDLLLRDLNGVSHFLTAEASRPTTSKIRYLAGGQQLLRADREISMPVSDAIADALASKVEIALQGAALLIVSDYGKGTVTDHLAARVIDIAKKADKPVIVDPKSRDFGRYAGATLITPNLKEMAEAADEELATEDRIVNVARDLLSGAGIGTMLVTRGAQGMSLISADIADYFPSRAREVFDVSGAGDTVIATLSAGIAAGLSVVDAAGLANVAAGVVVGKTGTAVAYAEDIRSELDLTNAAHGLRRPATLDAALDRIRTWKGRGETIGFTNGCFDLLHPGHVSLLSQARATCDRLVVGLNADSSVKRLKGESRPTQNEDARAAVLSSLETVDLVILFEEDTPERLLHKIKPHVLVKGADYTIETVVGADFVKSYGGQVVLVEIVPGFSTTATIARLNAS
ncbi:MAG: D-glycero-beta-D-manno-heptose-7-phosphate kinase [Pseudomonadota bacterium]|nr:D-glycero-beta-D-manno-heptose-7-phosphate kinase [Pseudomonadota bacterium]